MGDNPKPLSDIPIPDRISTTAANQALPGAFIRDRDLWQDTLSPCFREYPAYPLRRLARVLAKDIDGALGPIARGCYRPVRANDLERADRHSCEPPTVVRGQSVSEKQASLKNPGQ